MIRASATAADGRGMMILGLSDENIARLRKGQPIMFPADELGFTGDVAIISGRDEDTMRAQLAEYFEIEDGRSDG